jgi:hypothetical protein
MKRFTLITLITILATSFAKAQLNGDGYYRIQNNKSERYITIDNDIVGEVNMSDTKADLTNIITWRGFEYVESNPASIIYINAVDSKYNLSAQGTSIYKIAGGRTYLDINTRADCYLLSVTYKGVNGKLKDSSTSRARGNVTHANQVDEYMLWRILPVNTTDNYLGLKPTVETNDGWYGTLYAEYPFKVVSEGIKVYYVDGVHEGQFQLNEITDEVKPGATPLVFKCSSSNPADNKIMPVYTSTTAPTDNKLKGTYFACTTNLHEEYIEYNANTMRVLGADANKNLVLTKASESYLAEGWMIPMNTCYLVDQKGISGDFKLVTRSEFTGISSIEANTQKNATKGTFTLSGVQVDDNKALRPGVYIKDGKKIVIK